MGLSAVAKAWPGLLPKDEFHPVAHPGFRSISRKKKKKDLGGIK